MFVRFRQPAQRLQASLVETRRSNGKVRYEHIAGLGSIVTPSSVADRIAFWNRLHERLVKLSNRVDVDTEGKVLGAVHARIPMPTVDEQRAVQLENARAERDGQAKERIARIKNGEEVTGGLGKSVTHDDLVAILLGAGWGNCDMRGADQVAKLSRSAHSKS
jgi:hypothetical protein